MHNFKVYFSFTYLTTRLTISPLLHRLFMRMYCSTMQSYLINGRVQRANQIKLQTRDWDAFTLGCPAPPVVTDVRPNLEKLRYSNFRQLKVEHHLQNLAHVLSNITSISNFDPARIHMFHSINIMSSEIC